MARLFDHSLDLRPRPERADVGLSLPWTPHSGRTRRIPRQVAPLDCLVENLAKRIKNVLFRLGGLGQRRDPRCDSLGRQIVYPDTAKLCDRVSEHVALPLLASRVVLIEETFDKLFQCDWRWLNWQAITAAFFLDANLEFEGCGVLPCAETPPALPPVFPHADFVRPLSVNLPDQWISSLVARHGCKALRDAGAPAPGILELEREQVSDRYEILRYGGGGAPTMLVCGAVRLDHPAARNLVEILLAAIHLEASGSAQPQWM